MTLNDSIEAVRKEFRAALESFPDDKKEIEVLRIKFLGRKGAVADLFSRLGNIEPSERPNAGKRLNELKVEITQLFDSHVSKTTPEENRPASIEDFTLPGYYYGQGNLHPLEQTINEMKDIFSSIGFSVSYGPEIDDDYHNFEALNIPKHHPSRDMQDTFFVDENTVLRTHTSNVQIHLMEEQKPPLRSIMPGRVFRNEAISFKSYCLFHQVEGLYVDENVSFRELKGTIEYFVRKMFGSIVKIRFRPSYFPFTEPSAEVDIWNGQKNSWMEILGCGMVDPAVFQNVGYDPEKWKGYAFGMGVERITMLKYGIRDIRTLYGGDIRFLKQF